jgi:hypothetical protein
MLSPKQACRLAFGGLLVTAGLAIGAVPASAAGSFIWTGATTSPNWSTPDNWAGDVAPSGDVDSLEFPASLTSGDCTNSSPTDTCYSGSDDISGLAATAITIDDGVGYLFNGSAPLTIGSGGITATTSSTVFAPAEIDAPITLDSAQTWSINGGGGGEGQLTIGSETTGAEPLAVTLTNVGFLEFGAGAEVGNITVTGADSAETGLNADVNGAIVVEEGFDADDGSHVGLTNVALIATGMVGALTLTGSLISADGGSIGLNGPSTLNPTSVVQVEIADGASAFTQVNGGLVDLDDAGLDITGTDGTDCPTLPPGASVTVLDATFTGSFGGIANDDVIPLDCTAPAPSVQIEYGSNFVNASVPASVTLAASTSSPAPEETVALTAAVDSGPSASGGTVAFESNGVPIAGCGAVTVYGPPSSDAKCFTPFTPGQYAVEARFSPSSQWEAGGISSTLSLTDSRLATQTSFNGGFDPDSGVYPGVAHAAFVTVGPAAFYTPGPTGTVEFLENGVPVPGCTAVPLVAQAMVIGIAECWAHPGARGFSAVYSGDTNWLGSSTPVVAGVTFPSKVAITNAHVKGSSLSALVSCKPSGSALVTLKLTAQESIVGGKVVAVTASKSKRKRVVKLVTVAKAIVNVGPSGSARATVALNATGRRLLASFHTLSTSATALLPIIGAAPYSSSAITVTFRKARKK